MGRTQLSQGNAIDITVEVRDKHGEWVLTVTVSMTVRWEGSVLAYA
jgi:hypothetical protein